MRVVSLLLPLLFHVGVRVGNYVTEPEIIWPTYSNHKSEDPYFIPHPIRLPVFTITLLTSVGEKVRPSWVLDIVSRDLTVPISLPKLPISSYLQVGSLRLYFRFEVVQKSRGLFGYRSGTIKSPAWSHRQRLGDDGGRRGEVREVTRRNGDLTKRILHWGRSGDDSVRVGEDIESPTRQVEKGVTSRVSQKWTMLIGELCVLNLT